MPSWGGCSRRRFLALLLFQLIAMCLVYTVLQCLTTDIGVWLPRTLQQELELYANALTTRDGALPFADDVVERMPFQNELSRMLSLKNEEVPRNRDLFPVLAADHIPIVIYVHNRPHYLQVVVDSLARVKGIEETLLIVSHDGHFLQMNAIVESIRFCQVKQIFAPFSPHVFHGSFPGESPEDCRDQEDPSARGCVDNRDQYGHHRISRMTSLKHHWWWMMNTVWDGLLETRNHDGNILFLEEDHFLLPNAYRSIEMLRNMKARKCPECLAVNLAPNNVNSKGEGYQSLVVEKIGNVGYSFNRTVFNWIHGMAKPFCEFDDYNWDITMWVAVYPSFSSAGYSLRGPRASAMHFGKCGLHQGQGQRACVDHYKEGLPLTSDEVEPFLSEDWRVNKLPTGGPYNKGFRGWGGWGDKRDQQLCLQFSSMYHRPF